jgi:hypothetical protein
VTSPVVAALQLPWLLLILLPSPPQLIRSCCCCHRPSSLLPPTQLYSISTTIHDEEEPLDINGFEMLN